MNSTVTAMNCHSDSWAPPSPRTWSGTLTLWKRPSRGCTFSASWESSTGAADTVLLCCHWICPLLINNCLVQLSYQIWSQKSPEDSPDCWANHWYNPPHSPRTVLIQSEQKGLAKSLWPLTHPAHSLFELLPSGRLYRALSTRTIRHKNSFFSQAIHLMNTWH